MCRTVSLRETHTAGHTDNISTVSIKATMAVVPLQLPPVHEWHIIEMINGNGLFPCTCRQTVA